MKPFESNFVPANAQAFETLRQGRILGENESPSQMIDRVVHSLATQDSLFGGQTNFAQSLGELLDSGKVAMSTPVLTNAGRHPERPLSACTMPTVDLHADKTLIAAEIKLLHEQGMGTGFNLTNLDDPVTMLHFLNDKAVEGANSRREERPVGNMAIIDVYHPKISQFIDAKIDAPNGDYSWKFNLSVNVDESFMQAVDTNGEVTMLDGTIRYAGEIFEAICEAACVSADPGLIFMDRMNERNPLPLLGEYKTTAPCAEVGLIEGESCQFGYINVGKFYSVDQNGTLHIDTDGLYDSTTIMTRALDDALQISIANYSTEQSSSIMTLKRKIGVGICGVADAISIAGFPYDSQEARDLMLDALMLINLASKQESIRLAAERGACGAMDHIIGNRYYDDIPQLVRLYGEVDTSSVRSDEWHKLSKMIKESRLLRNITTIALPPTGRSALIVNASTGIEPHFRLAAANEAVRDALGRHVANEIVDRHGLLADATMISPFGHIAMAATLQRGTDEAISKTINMPAESSAQTVATVYRKAYEVGMSGVTIYVDGTFGHLQPIELDKKAVKL